MNKLVRYFLLLVAQLLLILLPVLVIYSFIKTRKQSVDIKGNLKHIAQHYFLISLFCKWDKKNSIMIHAVSLGEVDAALNLINSFDREVKERVILTVTSVQAWKKLQTMSSSIRVIYFPFDSLLHQIIFVYRFNIKKSIIIEHDFWPGFLAVMNILKREVILLNCHVSDKTVKYLSYAYYQEFMFSPIKNVFVQTDTLRKKLLHIMPDINVSVAPGYKLPLNIQIKNIASERKILTISNFHQNEIETVNIFLSKLMGFGYKIVLVPRHIHLFDDFIQSLVCKYTNQVAIVSECSDVENNMSDIIFIKSYGVLNKIYSISHASIVFGSFDARLKGHNLFEPLIYGSMIYYGPYFSSQAYMDELLHSFIPDIKHDVESICHQIANLTTQERVLIYNRFVNAVEQEGVILIEHFKRIEKWLKREKVNL